VIRLRNELQPSLKLRLDNTAGQATDGNEIAADTSATGRIDLLAPAHVGLAGWLLFKLVRPSPAAVDLVTESMFALRSSAVTAAVAPRREANFASDNPRATSHI
jgi:hypothetical protein